jgi:predicted amino acid dehydrogenase
MQLSSISGVRSRATGRGLEGWLLACPLTAAQMLRLPPALVYRKIVQAGRLAQRRGARIMGLGAYTSVVGDGGRTVAARLEIPVTTGNSLTVAAAVETLRRAARCRAWDVRRCRVAVVGATGSIGAACAEMMAPAARELILVGRDEARLAGVAARVTRAQPAARVSVTTEVAPIARADLVLSATSSATPVIEPEHLKRNAVVCDIARPLDVSPRVMREREDVWVIEGGVFTVPGRVDFGFDFGLLPGQAYACMVETMVLALEGRYEPYSLGKTLGVTQAREIFRMALDHGFELAAFERRERAVLDEHKEVAGGPRTEDPVWAAGALQVR